MTLAAAGKTEEALPLLSRNEGDAIGHANLGYLLASTGQYEHARQEYQTALSMRPDLDLAQRPWRSSTARNRLSSHADDRGRPQRPARCQDSSIRQVTTASAPANDLDLPPLPPRAVPSARRSCPVARCPGREVGLAPRSGPAGSFSPVGRDEDFIEPRPAIADPIDLVPAGDADQVLLPGPGRVDLGHEDLFGVGGPPAPARGRSGRRSSWSR